MRKIFVVLLCIALPMGAQSSPSPAKPTTSTIATPLTLAQVIDLAHRANPTLLSAAQHLAAVRAQEITAGLRQNPGALLGTQMVTLDPGDANGTWFYQIGVSRLFERGGKRDARLDNARSTTALTASNSMTSEGRQTWRSARPSHACCMHKMHLPSRATI